MDAEDHELGDLGCWITDCDGGVAKSQYPAQTDVRQLADSKATGFYITSVGSDVAGCGKFCADDIHVGVLHCAGIYGCVWRAVVVDK